MLTDILLPDPDQLFLEDIIFESQRLELVVSAKSIATICPFCGTLSSRIHSHYQRTLADLPCAGWSMRLLWNVRRFFCDHPECSHVTFSEQIPSVACRYARKTNRLVQQQTGIAFEVGGEPGSRLSTSLRVPTSPDTLLRFIRTTPEEIFPIPQFLGVDDWAIRRGQTYGTILVDLETHRAIDLLCERSADKFANWLKAHPGITIISRDRSKEYAKGASQGAPEARQVADRWHLLKNLREALELFLEQNRACLYAAANSENELAGQPVARSEGRETQKPIAPKETTKPLDLTKSELSPTTAMKVRLIRREKRLDRYRKVIELHQQGFGIREIARLMQIDRVTVRKYIQAGEFPEIAQRRKIPSKLDPHSQFLEERWDAGCHNRLQLWREIRKQGFTGSQQSVYIWARQRGLQKTSKPTPARKQATNKFYTSKVHPWSASRTVWLLFREETELKPEERSALVRMKQEEPKVELVIMLAQEFRSMVKNRQLELLPGWLDRAADSEIDALKGFVNGLLQDLPAIEAALSLPWSNGVTEGQVNRLKLVKRKMYGRANFDLLRRRFLGMSAGP
jgi:transposase